MQFGVSWVPDDLGGYADLVRGTEAIGVDRIGVPDSQASRYRECYTTLSELFHHTTRVTAGPLVTNPLTRHPAVTAAAIASADELSGGRAFICLATGDTGVFNLGMRPAKLAQLEEYVLVLRDLFHHGRATFRGDEMRLEWVGRHVPILIAAGGPRALRLAGRIADGVVVGMGFTPDAVSLVNQYVAEGAAEGGRSLDDLEVWYMARAAVADRREDAVRLVRPSLAAAGAHAFRFSLDGKAVPDEFVEAVVELERRYDLTAHNMPGEGNPNGRLVEELGLTDYLADRMGVVGTERQCIDKLTALRDRGIHNVIVRPLVLDRHDFLRRWGRVIAAVRADAATGP